MSKPHRTPRLQRVAQRIRERRRLRSRPHPALIGLAVAAYAALLLTALAGPFLHAHLQAVAVLDLVGGQPVPTLIRHVASEPVSQTVITVPTANGPLRARLYTPVEHPNAPALVVLHGVHHLGMDEPRMIAFAAAMASCGLRVLTPELPGIKDYRVTPDSIRAIGDSAQWFAVQNPGGERRAVGVMGLSFAGGLSLLAAADPEYQASIKFVVAVGSQYSMTQVAQYYRTGEDPRPQGATEFLQPHEYGSLVVEYGHLEDFLPAGDVPALRAVLRAHLYEDKPAETAALAALNPQQAAEAKQLMDTTSPRTRVLLKAAEARNVEYMQEISPRGHLAHLQTPVYLLHGAGDNIIPSAETLWMAAELPTTSLKAELISPVLSHLDLDGAQPGAMDRWRLVHFFALLLHAAEIR